MAIARFLDRMRLTLQASGLWLCYATLQNLIPSFPWIAPPVPHTLHPGAIQGKEGITFCHLATLTSHLSILIARDSVVSRGHARAVHKWPIFPRGRAAAVPSRPYFEFITSAVPKSAVVTVGGRIPFHEVLEEGQNAVILKLASASLVNSVQVKLCTRKL